MTQSVCLLVGLFVKFLCSYLSTCKIINRTQKSSPETSWHIANGKEGLRGNMWGGDSSASKNTWPWTHYSYLLDMDTGWSNINLPIIHYTHTHKRLKVFCCSAARIYIFICRIYMHIKDTVPPQTTRFYWYFYYLVSTQKGTD